MGIIKYETEAIWPRPPST